MCIACWIPKATNTRTDVILIAFPLQQCLHKRASMLRYTYIICVALRIYMKKKVHSACVHTFHHTGMWQECRYDFIHTWSQHRYKQGVNFMPQTTLGGGKPSLNVGLDGRQEFVWILGRRESSRFCTRNWPKTLGCLYLIVQWLLAIVLWHTEGN
jgi:hypothetical protein